MLIGHLAFEQVMQMRAKEFGPIYKEQIGGWFAVVISDLDEYSKVIKADGRYPKRREVDPLVYYLKRKGMSLGIVNR